MGVVRRFAVAGLEDAARRRRRGGLVIGALDETGQGKAVAGGPLAKLGGLITRIPAVVARP